LFLYILILLIKFVSEDLHIIIIRTLTIRSLTRLLLFRLRQLIVKVRLIIINILKNVHFAQVLFDGEYGLIGALHQVVDYRISKRHRIVHMHVVVRCWNNVELAVGGVGRLGAAIDVELVRLKKLERCTVINTSDPVYITINKRKRKWKVTLAQLLWETERDLRRHIHVKVDHEGDL